MVRCHGDGTKLRGEAVSVLTTRSVEHSSSRFRTNLGRLAAATAVLLIGASCANDKTADGSNGSGSSTSTAAKLGAFQTYGNIGAASATGFAPETKVELVDAKGKVAGTDTSDANGGAVVETVEPGDGYTFRSKGESSKPFRVLSRTDKPAESLYTGQKFDAGLNYIKMRDGVELAMTLRLPADKTLEDGPFPTVIEYSGYEVAPPHDLLKDMSERIANPDSPRDPLAPSSSTAVGSLIAPLLGFATVSVQIRGSGCSGGTFDLFGLPTIYDGYDAIETVAAQPWVLHNKVGMVGISYSGYSQLFVGGTQPPHLAALAPMSVTDDLYDGIGFPGGIQNTGFATGWLTERQHDAEVAPEGGQEWAKELVKQGDKKCTYNQILHGQTRNVIKILSELESRDPKLFTDRVPGEWFQKINVPTFLIGGLQDEQLGSHWLQSLGKLSKRDDFWIEMFNGNHNDALQPAVITRWVEFLDLFVAKRIPSVPGALIGIGSIIAEQASSAKAPTIQQTELASQPTYEAALAAFRARPKVRVLLDVGSGPLGAGALEPGYEHTFSAWPPAEVVNTTWYLGDNFELTKTKPSNSDPRSDTYNADPDARPEFSQDSDAPAAEFKDEPNNWVPLADGKGLTYTTPALSDDLMIAGASSFDAWVTATTPDTDMQVTLSEMRPDGQEMYVQTGWLRASHRKLDEAISSANDPRYTHLEEDFEKLSADKPNLMRVGIYPVVHTFRAGSKIRISVSAVGGDRPIWKFDTIDDGSTDVNIFRSTSAPSALVLPVVPGAKAGAPLPRCGTIRGQECRNLTPQKSKTE